ncbi:MAG: AAA family ATPase [Nitrososphaerota archaeon]|jgi:AAA15 family ATPase/GTPase|nr:ATP-binding protein [Nitrososphaerota archaeon]MDG7045460.1 AAA family ATPase [Nitrososphaerota archaeon]
MINKLTIEYFKAIDFIEIHPRKLNILVGRNNTGKTSVLEALNLMQDSHELPPNYQSNPSNLINHKGSSSIIQIHYNRSKEEKLELYHIDLEEFLVIFKKEFQDGLQHLPRSIFLFLLHDLNKTTKLEKTIKKILKDRTIDSYINKVLDVESNREKIQNAAKMTLRWYDGRNSGYFKGHPYSNVYDELIREILSLIAKETPDVKDLVRHTSDIIPRYMLYGFSANRRKETSYKRHRERLIYIKDPIESLKSSEQNESVANEVQKIIKEADLIQGLERFSFNSIVLEGDGIIPLNLMGDGFRVLISLLATLAGSPPRSVILLEEPEVHMHPGYIIEFLKYLIRLSKRGHHQIFITTHSFDLIDSVVNPTTLSKEEIEFLKRNTNIIRLNKKEKAGTIISEEMNIAQAKESLNDVGLDLRGI